MATTICGEFEWDDAKAEANERKHGVTFEAAALAVDDTYAVVFPDGAHIDRVNVIGMGADRVLFVVATERGHRTRIISARRATPAERRAYEEG